MPRQPKLVSIVHVQKASLTAKTPTATMTLRLSGLSSSLYQKLAALWVDDGCLPFGAIVRTEKLRFGYVKGGQVSVPVEMMFLTKVAVTRK
jgi:hypothetical protein